jgi:Kef-type K+ transport system membrane component KefB/nucleotide-binding universal stress UspA family protein
MEQVLKPLGGHEVLLLLLQMAALLTVARLGSELVRRMGLPTVVGELAAGLLLGPTVFGHFFPGAFHALFPAVATQFHLLEVVSSLGMVMLLLLTGVETDVRLVRNLGAPAAGASLFGMAVPFAFGFGLGMFLPVRYVASPDHRVLFALFLATALAISAMPVIAKILLDLGLTRRNIGVVIMSAGVVDDTTGWLILSLIAGAATGGGGVSKFLFSSIGTLAFVALAAFVLYPSLRFAMRMATNRFHSKDTDLVLMLVVTLLCAALTDWLGVHAVFGAFIAGCVFRQVPHLRPETLHKLESVTFSVFGPIFFGLVGLKVDLWRLGSASMLLIVLGVACLGKLVGVLAGGMLGGLRFWESVSIAVAMNARGAMELVVATIGLSLGLLNQDMYSIIVLVAILTSFMAPLLLRVTMRMVRMTEEEAERIAAETAKGMFDPAKLRVLVPTAGGPNALVAARLGLLVSRGSAHPATILYVERVSGRLDWIMRRITRNPAGQNLDSHLDRIRSQAAADACVSPEVRKTASRNISGLIVEEAAKGYDLIMVGASGSRRGVRGEMLEELVDRAPCHVAIVRYRAPRVAPLAVAAPPMPPPEAAGPPGVPVTMAVVDSGPTATPAENERPFARLLVPIDGSLTSRAAIELALRYAENVPGAEVTLVYVEETLAPSGDDGGLRNLAVGDPASLQTLSPVFKTTKVPTRVRVLERDTFDPLLSEARSGRHDLIVLGAENRAIHHRLFFGADKERLLEQSPISSVLVVPHVAPGSQSA